MAVTVTVTNDTSDDATTPMTGVFDALAEYDGDNDGSINKGRGVHWQLTTTSTP